MHLSEIPPLSKYFQACSQKYWQLPFPLLVNQFNLVLPAPNAAHIALFCRFENPISLRLIKRDSFEQDSLVPFVCVHKDKNYTFYVNNPDSKEIHHLYSSKYLHMFEKFMK